MNKYSIEMILATLNTIYRNVGEEQIHYLLLSHGDITKVSLNDNELTFKHFDNILKHKVFIANDTFDNKVIKTIIEGDFQAVESFRGVYFNLMKQCSTKRYVIRDEISMKLSSDSYPYINKIENLLRQYIMNFMILKVGDDWWKLNVSDNDKEKSNKRNGKSAFQDLIDQDIYHIDFKDLLAFIYDNFSAFKTKNEVLDRLKSCATFEEFEVLKNSVMSNKERFFEGIFDDSFKEKWKELAELRNLIAHNKLLEKKNYDRIVELSEFLESVLNRAMEDLQNYEVSEAESEVYRETVQHERNTIVTANLTKLSSEYDIDMDDIKEAIKKVSQVESEEFFTLVELVKELTGENYITREPINSYLGYVLGNAKNELGIQKGEQRITYVDETEAITTLASWKLVGDREE